MKLPSLLIFLVFLPLAAALPDEAVIADHDGMDITQIPPEWIDETKKVLHIAYGHTSHGSQVTSGMTGLVTFTGGCGGPQFAWNNGGTGGALDLHDNAMGGDCGYYPQWVDNTRAYLDHPANADVNVIIWSWCGQHSGYTQQDMLNKYLLPMTQLEQDYPHVMFAYMTGHLNYWSKANTDARNQQIRDYCIDKKRILYDFAHIESYDPDNTFFEYAHDNCDYWDAGGTLLGNWAIEWQNSHVQGVDWYACSSAHSQPLNANQKAYGAWWLWARLAGWPGPGAPWVLPDTHELSATTGGQVTFTLDAGTANGGRSYALLGSVSGTSPGFPLPGGLETLPLNWDALTGLIFKLQGSSVFADFIGTLDSVGRSTAVLDTLGPLPPAASGATLYFAYTLCNPFDAVSGPVQVQIVP